MADHAVLPPRRETVARTDPEEVDDLTSLRAILVGPAEQKLQALQARIDDRFAQARDVGAVLPQALLHRASDPELARALTPPVERAITASVRRDPRPLADALFPVIGPAIRKAIAASLALSGRAGLPHSPQDRTPAPARPRGPRSRRRCPARLGDADGDPRFCSGLFSRRGTGFARRAESRRPVNLDRAGPGGDSRGGHPRYRAGRVAAGSPAVARDRSSSAC